MFKLVTSTFNLVQGSIKTEPGTVKLNSFSLKLVKGTNYLSSGKLSVKYWKY